jgi:hypothetical protein
MSLRALQTGAPSLNPQRGCGDPRGGSDGSCSSPGECPRYKSRKEKWALNENLTKCAFYAAFCKALNSPIRQAQGSNAKKMGRIRGFVVEMTHRGPRQRNPQPNILVRPRCLETRKERGFPHFHSDRCYCCFQHPKLKAAEISVFYRFLRRTEKTVGSISVDGVEFLSCCTRHSGTGDQYGRGLGSRQPGSIKGDVKKNTSSLGRERRFFQTSSPFSPSMAGDGYLLHSPNPYRLWFRVGFNSGVKDSSQGNGFDYQRLLHEAEEELAPAF